MSRGGTFHVSADVTNSGSVAGTDVVQLYLHESDTTILQPVKKLEGFQRVTLAPGQTKTVTFTLGPQNLGFYDEQGQFVVEPGPFDVWVGDSSVGVGLNSPGLQAHVHPELGDAERAGASAEPRSRSSRSRSRPCCRCRRRPPLAPAR